jgi:hypothetical protein
MTTTETSTSQATALSEVKSTVLEEKLTKQDLMSLAFNSQCSFETDFPPNLLAGSVYVRVSEAENPGVPAQIIDSNEGWLIDVYWNLYGQAAQLICGTWRLKVFMESLGRDDLDLEIPPNGLPVPSNPYQFYHIQFYIPPNYVKVERNDGTPFDINVVTALIANNGKPSPIIGYCSVGHVLFFYEGIEI